MRTRTELGAARRWVIKAGSSLVTRDGAGLDHSLIAAWVEQLAALAADGREIVLVSSGAVAEGMARMGWRDRPHALHDLQAAAAIGQMGLVQAYETAFQRHGLHTAQVLLTHDDLAHRQRYLNARSTLRRLVELRVIPVINENDTVAMDEIRFGDNDTLAALVAGLVEADLLIILTDQPGMFDRDPRGDSAAHLLPEVDAGDPALDAMATGGGALGRGGMITKVRAARRAAASGTATLIAHGRTPGVLAQIAAGDGIGTLFQPGREPLAARKQWLASFVQIAGRLVLDEGAAQVLRASGKSLLPVGVRAVEGEFARGEVVCCVDTSGTEVARGLVNYSAAEARRIAGQPSQRIEELLGYVDAPELIHRDNLVVL
jgi:glutamate 5-kinase